VRVLIFHGYLLVGTGSNVYNAELAAALVRAGHEVHLVCQDRDPLALDWVDAAGTWDSGALALTTRREPARATVYRPDIGGLLPLYVADRYDGIEARPFPDLSETEVNRYVDANVAAVREVAERVRPDVALANHLVMGPVILARALGDVPYAVKIHGSALEYTVKPHPRFMPYAVEGLARAGGILVGSRHTGESLWEALGDPAVRERTRLGPPGVDVERFTPRAPAAARAGLAELQARLATLEEAPDESSFARTAGEAGAALAAIEPDDRLVVFVGKLIASKGVDLLLAAWPLVVARVPDARLVVVGFGTYRDALESFVGALRRADVAALREIAARGRELEGGPAGELRYLNAFLDSVGEDWLGAAPAAAERVHFTGRLEHDDLPLLLPACEAQVMPSTFPESFGMVAAEAAAAGVPPVSAHHSGLAEVSRALADELPPDAAHLVSFPLDDGAVRSLADRITGWLDLDPATREPALAALRDVAARRWSWEGVARTILAASAGDLDALPRPQVAAATRSDSERGERSTEQ
jgi:glycosyltransferase involved in cell wall biosynthesis